MVYKEEKTVDAPIATAEEQSLTGSSNEVLCGLANRIHIQGIE
jgi:hypothetical protein